MQNSKKYTVGVILYSSVGTNTSILLSEFLFFNKFAELNPDTKFVFIPVTKVIENKLRTKLHLLEDHVDYEVLKIDTPLNMRAHLRSKDFSGFFSYMLRNNFFGGVIDPRCKMNYIICSCVTNDLNKPLFFRVPDSEYNYQDYKQMINVRSASKTSGPKFKEDNKSQLLMINAWPLINYENVYWIANGSDQIYDWAPNVLLNNVKDYFIADGIEDSLDKVLYVSDDILFGYHENLESLNLECNPNHDNKITFAGYLKGSVASKRPKRLKEIFGKNKHEIPTRIFGPGCKEIPAIQDKDNIELMERSFQGDEYIKFLNEQFAIIHFGKGKDNYSYVAKSIYDCGIAGVPSLIYLPCDQKRLIFNHPSFYFSDEAELKKKYIELQSPGMREEYVRIQREWIDNTLTHKMYETFKFSDYCEPCSYGLSVKLF